jgi:hypothetical protein
LFSLETAGWSCHNVRYERLPWGLGGKSLRSWLSLKMSNSRLQVGTSLEGGF